MVVEVSNRSLPEMAADVKGLHRNKKTVAHQIDPVP